MWSSTDRLIAFLIWIRHQVIVSLLIFIIISTVISLSISVYSAFYYFYVPSHFFASSHLNFLFTPCDVTTQNEKGYTKCSFPTATVNLRNSKDTDEYSNKQPMFFQQNQKYTIQVHLNLAALQTEQLSRMFVVCLTLLDYNQNPLSFSGADESNGERCIVSTLFPKSTYAQLLDFLLSYPIQAICNVFEQSSLCEGLAMTTELTHWKKITFHNEYENSNHLSATQAVIRIKDVQIEALQATFLIRESNLILWKDPILYLMTNHSNLTCVITVLTISIPALILILMAWDRLTKPTVVKQAYTTQINNSASSTPSAAKKPLKNINISSRYDQARQRLKESKTKLKYGESNLHSMAGSESQISFGQVSSTPIESEFTNNESQCDNMTDMGKINKSKECFEENENNLARFIGSNKDAEVIGLISTDSTLNVTYANVEELNLPISSESHVQHQEERHKKENSISKSCLQIEKNSINLSPNSYSSISNYDNCEAVLRRRKEP